MAERAETQPTHPDPRRLILVQGPDAKEFLQGLVTNDVAGLETGAVYAALLTPQGKYLVDFFMVAHPDGVLLDLPEALADGLVQRLNMYKLRADVTLAPLDWLVARGLGAAPDGALADPRDPGLGWRLYGPAGTVTPETAEEAAALEAKRIALCVPAAGAELQPNETYILESGFERLNGVDFRKGCYVGQEIVARMKHKLELRKGLVRVLVPADQPLPVGSDVSKDGKPVGTLYSQADGIGLAHLRFDRAGPGMKVGEVEIALADEA